MGHTKNVYMSDDTYAKLCDLGVVSLSQFLREVIDEAHADMLAKNRTKELDDPIQINDAIQDLEAEDKLKDEKAKLEEQEWLDFCSRKEEILGEAKKRQESGQYKGTRKVAESLAKYPKTHREILKFLSESVKNA